MTSSVTPFSLKDAPALIEKLLPVQKLSAESYKEQMAVHGKTLTALGSYWKGRKPLILNKACILGCLLPSTDDPARDLEIFEKLMAMDDESFVMRWKSRPTPKDILANLSIAKISNYFDLDPAGVLPDSSPVDWSNPIYQNVKVTWRSEIMEMERLHIEAKMLSSLSYRERVNKSNRPEEVDGALYEHIWESINEYLGTQAFDFPELIEQLGIMRFGHRPQIADPFCGSGQIPFEAARLGCDIFASDLNPVACMLTWGAFNIIGGSLENRENLLKEQAELENKLFSAIERLDVEVDGEGWHIKSILYCIEIRCLESGWMVPLLPTLIVSKGYRVIAELIPNYDEKRYDIAIRSNATDDEMKNAKKGTLRTDGRGQEPYLFHRIDGVEYRSKISTLRGDRDIGNSGIRNNLRLWEKDDIAPRPGDTLQERMYCIQWMRPKVTGNGLDYEFRSITKDDLKREKIVEDFISEHLSEWQVRGWIPDMRIETGDKTEEPIRTRGWTYWHHLFNPRQLFIYGLVRQDISAQTALILCQLLNCSSRLSRWAYQQETVNSVFDNQALNTLYNYGFRSSAYLDNVLRKNFPHFPLKSDLKITIKNCPATDIVGVQDIFISDPPYGDAVKYEEILEYFIAWLRKNPPQEFSEWIWDSRRSLAIKGEGEGFRRSMVASYKRMTECMQDNGLQVIMFTHQSGPIWADMANIVWSSGLQVTASWYVVTETDSALRDGSYVKGTVLLVCRKRTGMDKTTRDELAWEIQEEVDSQVQNLIGLNIGAKKLYHGECVFEDADIQMAGYAAALRALTRYTIIDGRDMTIEAIRPRVKGEKTFVDSLIDFAVDTANQSLVPQGIERRHWDKLSGLDRFYLKMLDMECHSAKKLDNYQNFAKAFKVRDFHKLMASEQANNARLRSAIELNRTEMGEGSEFYQSVLRAVLYGIMEIEKNVDSEEALAHLSLNIPNYYSDISQRELARDIADYLAKHLEVLRPEEASSARVLRDLVTNHRLG